MKKPYLFLGGPWDKSVHEIEPKSQHGIRDVATQDYQRYYRHIFVIGQKEYVVYLHNNVQPPAEIVLSAIRAAQLEPESVGPILDLYGKPL